MAQALEEKVNELRRDLIPQIEHALEREMTEQAWLGKTLDFQEGLAAVRERRDPRFTGN